MEHIIKNYDKINFNWAWHFEYERIEDATREVKYFEEKIEITKDIKEKINLYIKHLQIELKKARKHLEKLQERGTK